MGGNVSSPSHWSHYISFNSQCALYGYIPLTGTLTPAVNRPCVKQAAIPAPYTGGEPSLYETGRNPSTLYLKLREAKYSMCAGMAQSFYRLVTGWTVQGSNPASARFSALVQTGLRAHPSSCIVGIGSLFRVKASGAWRWPPTPI